jgi:hypothetical protein
MKIWKYHCYKKLAERDDDLEVGIFFLEAEGTLLGGSLNQRSLGGSYRTYTTQLRRSSVVF